MKNPLTQPPALMGMLRDQLGSIRRVYLRGNRIVRRDDFANHDEAVLLLHGFFQTRNVWEIMEERLRAQGYGVFSFDLGGLLWRFNTHSIPDLSASIADKLEGICARTGLERFHIIGHSKGGIVAQRRVQLTTEQAEGFYDVHRERAFFNDLVAFMTSGPVVVQVLEGDDAVVRNREIMGATNPANADEGTIRKDFAESIEANSVHGSDSPENAEKEIRYFFSDLDIVG